MLQDAKGNCKMRNIAHMKKIVEPAATEIEASKGPEQPKLPGQVVEPAQCDQPETKVTKSSCFHINIVNISCSLSTPSAGIGCDFLK